MQEIIIVYKNTIIYTKSYVGSASSIQSIVSIGSINYIYRNSININTNVGKVINGVTLVSSLLNSSVYKSYRDIIDNNDIIIDTTYSGCNNITLSGLDRKGTSIVNNTLKGGGILSYDLSGISYLVNTGLKFNNNTITGIRPTAHMFYLPNCIGVSFNDNTISGLRARTISNSSTCSLIGQGNIINGKGTGGVSTTFDLYSNGSYHAPSPTRGLFIKGQQITDGTTIKTVSVSGLVNSTYPTITATGTVGSNVITLSATGCAVNDIVKLGSLVDSYTVCSLDSTGLIATIDIPLTTSISSVSVSPYTPTII